jgi:nucleoside-diphosphate-sugar epimerase
MSHNNLHKRRALVTGGTGYVGGTLVRRLAADNWEVHVVVRRQVSQGFPSCVNTHIHDGTINGLIEIMSKARPDCVFHLASLFLSQHTSNDIEPLIRSNLLFSTQLLESMAVQGVRTLINTGTSWQHFNNEQYNPVNLYAATKEAFENVLAYYAKSGRIDAATIALFDTYGPNDQRGKLVSLLWKTALLDQSLDMSPGEQLVDLVYIDDVIDAFIAVERELSTRKLEIIKYGVSSGQPLSLRRFADVFERATGLKLRVNWGGRPYRDREVMIPWSNFTSPPGWKPKISFDEGIPLARPVL